MAAAMRCALALLLVVATAAAAEERFCVFEFFVRGSGTYCQAAAPAVRALQSEMAGRAVLLEYDYDAFTHGRADRWWAAYTGSPSVFLPLVMVGSGYMVDQGPVSYAARYRAMLDAELARAPAAQVRAWSQRVGTGLTIYVRATNLAGVPLTTDHASAFWAIVWEDARVGLTDTWVRATASKALNATLAPGDTTTATISVPTVAAADWERIRALVLLEHRPTGTGEYDMLQAAVAAPAALEVAPTQLALGPTSPSAQLALEGPHVLSWTATPEVAWLQVAPASGSLPATATISLVGTPAASQTGVVRIDASGSGIQTTVNVAVTTQGTQRRVRQRLERVSVQVH